jgi:hypothetical protein
MSRPLLLKLAVAPVAVLLAAVYLMVGPAAAEQGGRLDVAVSFDGKFSPRQLPRHRPAPVSLELSGSVRGTNGAPPPRLQRLDLAFGARGSLDTAGLPVCSRARLRNATQRQALERCRAALVGRGEISAEVPLNPAEPILAHAEVLAFNGRSNGRPAVWVLADSASPPVSFVLPFYLRRLSTGAYGILLHSPVRHALGRWPRLRSFEITLSRRYRAAGELHSYLNARCPLPPRFNELSVPVARATYYFAPRPTLTQPIRRLCQVRE